MLSCIISALISYYTVFGKKRKTQLNPKRGFNWDVIICRYIN